MSAKTIYDVPNWARVISETENFMFIGIYTGYVQVEQIEELFQIGLKCCGISAATMTNMVICCQKV